MARLVRATHDLRAPDGALRRRYGRLRNDGDHGCAVLQDGFFEPHWDLALVERTLAELLTP